ncbi:zinc finger C3HC-type protein 1-like [Procambarus clarkii]|uniref:zinc finger C3HC-type protein 1-like n=1 Tax=Procambarus clarkii TaxID=6728 RepID=UPI003743715B
MAALYHHHHHRILALLASVADTASSPSRNDDRTNPNCNITSSSKTQPQNYEAFCSRVESFQPGLWNVLEVSPLECARWGWHIIEKDILQCVTCREVVCAALPNPVDQDARKTFLNLLRSRLLKSHKEACGWIHDPSPEELTQPPCVTTVEELHNLTNSAVSLAAFNSALPHIDQSTLMKTLKLDDDFIKGVFTCSTADEEVKISSVVLVLSGWSHGEGAYLRCRVCRRSVGLWSFFTRADEVKNVENAVSEVTEPGQKTLKLPSKENEVGEEKSGIDTKATDDDRPSSKWFKRLRGKRVIEQGNEETLNKQNISEHNTRKKKKPRTKKYDSNGVNEAHDTKDEFPPLITGSPSPHIKESEKKRYFHPLEEHRHWCPWVLKIQGEESGQNEKYGYELVIEQTRAVINLSNRKDLSSSDKYAKNVDGLRSIRKMLNSLSSEY